MKNHLSKENSYLSLQSVWFRCQNKVCLSSDSSHCDSRCDEYSRTRVDVKYSDFLSVISVFIPPVTFTVCICLVFLH